ncbi:MAG: sigma factor G inhibitor Gin [Bacillales bacterium]|nr:sigma factor G inhibitor Gin [Bacillales bacterium]
MENQRDGREICIICENQKTTGIHLLESFICTDCEKKMTSIETKNSDYSYYVQKLKKIKLSNVYS